MKYYIIICIASHTWFVGVKLIESSICSSTAELDLIIFRPWLRKVGFYIDIKNFEFLFYTSLYSSVQ